MRTYLFLFTIGPVQSFIAQARKAQDLYAGSRLLSQLVVFGMKTFDKICQENKVSSNFIFPAIDKDKEKKSLPNRFIAKITTNSQEIIDVLGLLLKNEVKSHFLNIAADAIGKEPYKKVENSIANQLERHLDLHWAAVPLEENYKASYLKLEFFLGAVKNTRLFNQLNDGRGEKGRKCALDGINNAIFYCPNASKEPPALMYLNEDIYAVQNNRLNPGEALSALSYLKRNFGDNRFPSVASIALMEVIKRLPVEKLDYLEKFESLFEGRNALLSFLIEEKLDQEIDKSSLDLLNERYDHQYLYPENLNEKNFPCKAQFALAQKFAKEFHTNLTDKHYAVLMFDGDEMGKWLSGANLAELENKLESFHTRLSALLSDFADQTNSILEGKGQVIYAGGDDFLGLINLHHLFDVVKQLRFEFHKIVNSKIENKQEGKQLTFSAGIVVAHYKIPLSEVLKKVRKLEKKAKKEGGRNAFALGVIKHSGETKETVYKWDQDEHSPDSCSNWESLEGVFKKLYNGTFSSNFITNLTKTISQLTGSENTKMPIELNAIWKFEFKRLLKRSLIKNKTGDENEKEISETKEYLMNLFNNHSMAGLPKNFVDSLQIADFLSRRIQKFYKV